ncbi:MAG: alanine--glyoxylate aminotransferase family protein [Pseudomonadota bacterium]
MASLLPDLDPEGLLEYSVVFTDRSVNHMSQRFQRAVNDIHDWLVDAYAAEAAVLVPGGGSVAMESVARQLMSGKRCLVIRNGFFSFRWSQIFEMGAIPASETVLRARQLGNERTSPFTPPPIADVLDQIARERPDIVVAPHVETSAGMLLPDDYLEAVASAVHAVGGLFVLDCVASGAAWVDMRARGVDVLISAPQKGWTSTPCAGLVMLSEAGLAAVEASSSSSFALDLKKWLTIMRAYTGGGHAYHATLPTDGLITLRDAMHEARAVGLDVLRDRQFALGRGVRDVLASRGIASVAAPGFEAPGVVVCFTEHPDWHNGSAFARAGVQIAAGVPLQVGERPDYLSFRIGLFGLDKLVDVDGVVDRFAAALDRVAA